jgi:hypothetical protein
LLLARWIGRTLGASPAVTRAVALMTTAALCTTMLLWGVLPVARVQAVVDSRREVREWAQREADGTDRIAVAEELAILPSELERFPGEVTVLSADDLADRDPNEFDIALWGRFTHAEARGRSLPAGWEYVREFGRVPTPASPNIGRGSDELITIYRS